MYVYIYIYISMNITTPECNNAPARGPGAVVGTDGG